MNASEKINTETLKNVDAMDDASHPVKETSKDSANALQLAKLNDLFANIKTWINIKREEVMRAVKNNSIKKEK